MAVVNRRQELWTMVAQIPFGRITSYGALGRALSRPVSGLIVGKWMAECPASLPWWRVVAADGRLVVAKRHPALGQEQRDALVAEGVPFVEDRVKVEACYWEPSPVSPSSGSPAFVSAPVRLDASR